jgi:hypothetical protein
VTLTFALFVTAFLHPRTARPALCEAADESSVIRALFLATGSHCALRQDR